MHVTSEEGTYTYKKSSSHNHHLSLLDTPSPSTNSHEGGGGGGEGGSITEDDDPMAVCGLYVVTDPDKFVQISIKYLNVNCESGGLMAVRIYFLFLNLSLSNR